MIRAILLFCVVALAAFPAQAQFFAGKTITMVINYGVGGNADTEGRIFVRHLGKHIQGNPTIITQNMPGAGGLTAVNLMGEHIGIKNDGTSVGYFTFNPVAPIIDDPTLKVKMSDFAFVGGVGGWFVTFGRKDMLKGRPIAEGMKNAEIFAAGYAPSASHDVRLKLTLGLIGAKFKVVTGFPDFASVNKAMAQNEVNYTATTLPGFTSITIPQLIEPGIAQPIWQYPVSRPGGKFETNPNLTAQGIPSFPDIYAQAYGRPPSGADFEAFVLLNDIATKLARVVLMPQGSPPAAVAEMRKAFLALAGDRDFLAEYERIIHEKPDITGAEEGQPIYDRLGTVKPDVKAAMAKAVGG
jgi:tripartite-type tricarboxylate transporter receptor subunit TctC